MREVESIRYDTYSGHALTHTVVKPNCVDFFFKKNKCFCPPCTPTAGGNREDAASKQTHASASRARARPSFNGWLRLARPSCLTQEPLTHEFLPDGLSNLTTSRRGSQACVIMPDSQDWRGFLTASERYDNIQKLSVSLVPLTSTLERHGRCR